MLVETRDKAALQSFLEQRRSLNAYALGDLDEPYWPNTQWFTRQENGEISEVALLYKGFDPPILLALQNNRLEDMRDLISELSPQLPDSVYAHLTPGLGEVLESRYAVIDHGEHFVMELQESAKVGAAEDKEAVRLSANDVPALYELYEVAYPRNWFQPEMLQMGPYFGIRNKDGRLLSAGGVHVFSKQYSVAALGNIATLPEQRGRGLGRRVAAKLCETLLEQVDTIGLNVQASNGAAITIYRHLGFEPIAKYSEFTLTKK